MPSKYEIAADETVPVAKSIIARALVEKYNIREADVARYLGVAQAAVSKYVTEKYSDSLKKKVEEIEGKIQGHREVIDEYIRKIAEGKDEYVNVCVCTICSVANNIMCAFSHAYAESLAMQNGA